MVHLIVYSYITVALIQSYSCWIINDINPKMIAQNIYNKAVDDIADEILLKQVNIIFPGTKWCGPGNIAANDDDLGEEKEADMCCRDHDHCPECIGGGETMYNLTNDAFYSRLSCDCDNTFHDCLKAAGTRAAQTIGYLYFDALLTQCFRKDYPVIKCTKRGGWLYTKCVEYAYNTSAPQIYQWFDEVDF